MLVGTPQDGTPHEVDLDRQPFAILLTEDALRFSTHANLVQDGRIVLHIKYLPTKRGLVLNDMRGGAWCEGVLLDCEMPVSGGLVVTIILRMGTPTLTLPGNREVSLGGRFDLSGKLTAFLPKGVVAYDFDENPLTIEAAMRHDLSAENPGLPHGVDVFQTTDGAFFLEGWIDDHGPTLTGLSVVDSAGGQQDLFPVYRVHRPDVDSGLHSGQHREPGFWTAALTERLQMVGSVFSLVLADGSCIRLDPRRPSQKRPQEFLEMLLARLGSRKVHGNLAARSFKDLNAGLDRVLSRLHLKAALDRAVVTRAVFGPEGTVDVGVICVLYGISDFLYLLVSQFARFGQLSGIEFVFVNNSPELLDIVLRDAELASFVFDARIRIVSLNQNCGFSHANNAGVTESRAGTIAIINPDVYPRHSGAIAQLRALAESGPANEVRGGKLFYADGSIMHEGMYFRVDKRLSAISPAPVWMVEHYRKGFADRNDTQTRAVPAVTGALMVMKRSLYERLGGFSTDFIYGNFEDADLCLRAQESGAHVVIDPALAFWHYEGKGSTKRPEHVGANLYNHWTFSRKWNQRLESRQDE